MKHKLTQAGVTLTEVLVVSAISILVILAITAFIVRVYDLPAFQLEQGRITTDLRVEMERMSDEIRASDIKAFSNSDKIVLSGGPDGPMAYYLQGDNLLRSYDDDGTILGYSVQIVARGVRNQAQGVPLFNYYSFGGPKALEIETPIMDFFDEIGRVEINLIIDSDPNQDPGMAKVTTVVLRRKQPL